MDAALFQRFSPEEYHRRLLADGVRTDGRGLHERREAQLRRSAIGAAHGSASVRLGQSMAVAGIRAEVTEAVSDLPAEGRVAVTVELSPLCSPAFRERHRAVGISNFLSSALSDILNSSHVLDPLQLTIREGELFWVLHAHVVCVNFDGNAFDLCLLAGLAALEDVLLPALAAVEASAAGVPGRLVEVPAGSSDTVTEARRVALATRPLPVTFTQLPGRQWALDPCAAEEGLGTTVSLCFVAGRWLVFQQGGGVEAEKFVGELMPLARTCLPALTELLDGAAQSCGDVL